MPEFDFFAGSLGGSWGQLNSQKWSIDVELDIFSAAYPTSKEFLRAVSTIYHEARHGEQWFRCTQIVANGILPFPLQGMPVGPSQRVATNFGAMTNNGVTAENLKVWMFVPMVVAEQAERMKRFFPANMTALVTTWYNSIYGANRVYRNNVLNTMSHGGIETYVQYLNLPEEVDAWGLQRQVRDIIKGRMMQADDDWDGLPALFD